MVWIAGAVVFAILETLTPVLIFLGFAAGAAVVGVALALGVTFGASLPWMVVIFAAVSLVVTIALRMVLGTRKGETKTFEHDVNDG